MRLNIAQPPLNTTLMGVIRGVADFFKIELSTPMLYGRSGHAFLMNIHDELCPSGPYVWDLDPFISLLENSGIVMNGHGFFHPGSTAEERAVLEETLRSILDSGRPCSVVNLDHQIISGYDATGFTCIQPWECDFPPAHLTFGSWKEIEKEIHACFFSFDEVDRLDTAFCIQRSLLYAVQLQGESSSNLEEKYHLGISAYQAWIRGIEKGNGSSHGNWWNGTVWSECRKMASEYFREIAGVYPACSGTAEELENIYRDTALKLASVSDKELEDNRKIQLLTEAEVLERNALPLLEELAETIET